uniref:NS2 n=1 Tax=uncultured densovirus TaxID=748192 RepID=A0A7L7YUG0_9VIRU|nr:NS2 [uncultured densovirus]
MESAKRKLEFESESEEEMVEKEETEEEETKVTMKAVLRRVTQNQLPLSETHPGYLLGFLNLLQAEETLNPEVENSLYALQQIAKLWSNNIGKVLPKGPIEYFEKCKGRTANLFEISFGFKAMENIKTLLDVYSEINITKEDCCRYVEKTRTYTSCTTAHSAMGYADATGTKRQKLMEPTVDEIDVHIDEIPVEVEPQPTFKTYSSIIVRKNGSQFIRKLEDKWKDYQARVTIYRRQDLMDCPKSSDKWQYKYHELELNYNSGSHLSEMMNRIKGVQTQYLEEKNVKWEPKKEYSFKQ